MFHVHCSSLQSTCYMYMYNVVLHRQRESSKPDLVETDPLEIFVTAVENSMPVIGVTRMRRGGKVYHVSNCLKINQLCLTRVTLDSLSTDKPVTLGSQIELEFRSVGF